jgi:hypothetical protein
MSFDDVPPDEMGIDPHAADDALERMLFGAPVSDEWRDVASFVQELQEAVPAADLASEDLHVAAMVDTAHLLADTGDPVVRPVSNAAAPAPQASGLPKQRRKPMQRKKTVARLLIAPIAAAFVALGGMAYAGALPWSGHDPAPTTTVSPDDGDSQGLASEDDQGEDTQGDVSKDDTLTPPADDQGDQGENADDQGDNNDQGTTSDDQGDQSTSSDDQGENDDNQGDNNDQGEDSQGDSTDQSGDSQGDSTDQSGDSQGDSTGSDSTSGGDQGGDTTSGGDQGGDSQD